MFDLGKARVSRNLLKKEDQKQCRKSQFQPSTHRRDSSLHRRQEGLGKTAFVSMLVEWYKTQSFDIAVVYRGHENKAQSAKSFSFRNGKANVQRAQGLDDFLDVLDADATIIIEDVDGGP
jgi:hypothetical protein